MTDFMELTQTAKSLQDQLAVLIDEKQDLERKLREVGRSAREVREKLDNVNLIIASSSRVYYTQLVKILPELNVASVKLTPEDRDNEKTVIQPSGPYQTKDQSSLSSPSQDQVEINQNNDQVETNQNNNQVETNQDNETSPQENQESSTVETGSIDWNLLFQTYLDEKDTKEKFQNIASLARDFQYVAETYGRIIISEQLLPPEQQTIKQLTTVGGRAGGTKYFCQNILYKFAVDPIIQRNQYIYGLGRPNAEKAQKASCNELKGLTTFFYAFIKDIHVPIMTLIHYRGFCLIAISKLPIDHNTIKYGSDNGGITVHTDINLIEPMREFGRRCNLREHTVGDDNINIVGPGDIEIHLGTDNKYYALDFGRLLPPELPSNLKPGNPIFYDLLRPIFVQEWKTPLCSDGFSAWLKSDILEINNDLKQATFVLHHERIPAFAKKLADKIEKYTKKNIKIKIDYIISLLHQNGINCRHLGHICHHLRNTFKNKTAEKIIMTECVARAMKNQLRKKLRKKMEEIKIETQDPFYVVAYTYFKDKLYSLPERPTTFISNETILVHDDLIIGPQGSDTQSFHQTIADSAISLSTTIFYFEVKLESGSNAGIGLSPYIKTNDKFEALPFNDERSHHFDSSGESYSAGHKKDLSPWFIGDTIGIFYNSTQHIIIVTRNQKIAGTFHSIPNEYMYIPVVKVGYNTRLSFTLGQKPFLFDISWISPILKDPAEDFWKGNNKKDIRKQLSTRFIDCIDSSEQDSNSDLRNNIDMLLLIKRLNEITGVRFSDRLLNSTASEGIYIIESDIVELVSRNSQIGIIEFSSAVYNLLSVEESPQNVDTDLAKLVDAKIAISSVLKQTKIQNPFFYYYWGSILWEICKRQAHKEERRQKAWKKFKIVEEASEKEQPTKRLEELLGNTKFKQGEILLSEKKYDEAQEKFKETFSLKEHLICEKMSKINQTKLAPDLSNIEVYETGKVLWKASSCSRKNVLFVMDYFQILCTNISFIYRQEQTWNDEITFEEKDDNNTNTVIQEVKVNTKTLFEEVKEIFINCTQNFLEDFLVSFFSTSSMDGMHLAVLFKIFMEDPLVKFRDVLELKIPRNLTVTQNTPELFVKTVRDFSRFCISKDKKERLDDVALLNPNVTELASPADDAELVKIPRIFRFNPNITSLDLTKNRATKNGFDSIYPILHYLRYLNLSLSKFIDDEIIKKLLSWVSGNTYLISLNLWYTGMTDKCVPDLTKTLQKNTTLKELDIGHNLLTNQGINAVIAALSNNSSLEAFGISYSNLNDDMLLKIPQSLTYLDLAGNLITDRGVQSLLSENNVSLRYLEIEENDIEKKYIYVDISLKLNKNILNQPRKSIPIITLQKHKRLQHKFEPKAANYSVKPAYVDPNWPPCESDSDKFDYC